MSKRKLSQAIACTHQNPADDIALEVEDAGGGKIAFKSKLGKYCRPYINEAATKDYRKEQILCDQDSMLPVTHFLVEDVTKGNQVLDVYKVMEALERPFLSHRVSTISVSSVFRFCLHSALNRKPGFRVCVGMRAQNIGALIDAHIWT